MLDFFTKYRSLLVGAFAGAFSVIAVMLILFGLRGPTVLCTMNILCIKTNFVSVVAPQQIHATTPTNGATEIAVSWVTAGRQIESVLEYRKTDLVDWQTAEVRSRRKPANGIFGSRQWIHHGLLSDLEPGTQYRYRVSGVGAFGEREFVSDVFDIETLPAPITYPVRIGIVTDTGISDRVDHLSESNNTIIGHLLNDPVQFILGVGDYAYANREARFRFPEDAIAAWLQEWQPVLARTPFYPQWGNHDCCHWESTGLWTPLFRLPASDAPDGLSYSFAVGNVYFLSVFAPGVEHVLPSRQMLEWLDKELEAAREKHSWLVVYQHEPIYSHGDSHPANPIVRGLLAPIFEKHHVDLHISSHDQSYERTYPLMNVTSETFTVMTEKKQSYRQGEGVIYTKVSPSGKKSDITMSFSNLPEVKMPMIAIATNKANHYAELQLRSPDEIYFVAYAVAEDGHRSIVDQFSIKADTK